MKKSELLKIIRESIEKQLITEQSGCTNCTIVTTPNPNFVAEYAAAGYVAELPIIKRCSQDQLGNPTPVATSGYCRVYMNGAILSGQNINSVVESTWEEFTPAGVSTGNVGTTYGRVPYPVGTCFGWSSADHIECITDFASPSPIQPNGLPLMDYKQSYTCVDCGIDSNNNGIDDCIECTIFNGGCLDCPTCINYNPNATTDDGSCIGCTDSLATNYDPGAAIDNGQCTYGDNAHEEIVVTICGVSNPNQTTYQVGSQYTLNHSQMGNPNAGWICNTSMCDQNTDVGQVFEYNIAGGIIFYLDAINNPVNVASNMMPHIDDSTCPTIPVPGCTDPNATTCPTNPGCNAYDPNANIDDGSCCVNGCTDSGATNFVPLATCDDGSCILPGVSIEACECTQYQMNNNSCAGLNMGAYHFITTHPVTIGGNQPAPGDAFSNYYGNATQVIYVIDNIDIPTTSCPPNTNCDFTQDNCQKWICASPGTCQQHPAGTFNNETQCLADPSCQPQYNFGCLNPNATNHAPGSDGCEWPLGSGIPVPTNNSCCYYPSQFGCTDITATNYGMVTSTGQPGNVQGCDDGTGVPNPTDTTCCTYDWECVYPGNCQTTLNCLPVGSCNPTEAQCLASPSCQPIADTYDCSGAPNYTCTLNPVGQGQYTGATALQQCQTNCVAPTPIPGCADPTAPHCNTLPAQLQYGCYKPTHDGCGTPPNPNDTSCCQYSDNNIEPENPDNPTGAEGIYCECCKDNYPYTLLQLYPIGFDCTTLNNTGFGSNCGISPTSGGPGANDPNNPEFKCEPDIIGPPGANCPNGSVTYSNYVPNAPNQWWMYCYPCLMNNGSLPNNPAYYNTFPGNTTTNLFITGQLGNCECCGQIPDWASMPEWGDLKEGVKITKSNLIDFIKKSIKEAL